MAERQRVGFIGLGTMGRPMAKRVLQAGFPLTVCDVLAEPMEELVKLGAAAADSPRAVAEASQVVITMLPNSPHVEEAILGKGGVIEGLKPGAVVIDMSTIEPAVTRKVAEAVAARGGRMLDAPVGKSSAAAAEGTLTIMVGGDEATFQECRHILATMGTSIFHCGGIGAGATVKLVNNLMASVIIAAVAEGLTLGVKAGVKPETMIQVLGTSGASSFHLTNTFPSKALKGDLQPGFMLDLAYKDLGLIASTAANVGVPLPVTSLVRELAGMARQKGLGKLDWTSLIKLYEEWAGVEVRLGRE